MMEKKWIVYIILLLLIGGGISGCSDAQEYEISAPEDHPAYMISRQGQYSPGRFDTIFVFGHVNNDSVAREITNYLNEQEAGDPFRYRRFHPGDHVKGP